MSVNGDMKKVMLQEDKGKKSTSGAHNEDWNDVCEIDVAIYQNSDMIVTASAKYRDSSHTGLTYCKDIRSGSNRIVDGGTVYRIIGSNMEPRLANLVLKVVE